MKILFCHNYYRQRGGEDVSFELDVAMLRSRGHEVVTYEKHNDNIRTSSPVGMALDTVWNRKTRAEIHKLISDFRPDVLHCNNLFPQISASIYQAAQQLNVPVVQALRNYRWFCANSFFFRDGKVCTDCLQRRSVLPALRHRCYRDNLAATTTVVAMQLLHRYLRTHENMVNAFFTPSAFARSIYTEAGFDAERVFVKPNFVDPDPGMGSGDGDFIVFVGRLSPEKGLDLILSAWETGRIPLPLHVIGDGPLRESVQNSKANVRWLGQLPYDQVLDKMGQATGLIMASNWYETFGRTIAEGFSRGTPAIVSDMGAMAELVNDGVNGFRFEPGNVESLIEKVNLMIERNSSSNELRLEARRSYLETYTADASYDALLKIYNHAINCYSEGELVHANFKTVS